MRLVRNNNFQTGIIFILLNFIAFFATAAEETAPQALFQTPKIIIKAPDLSLPNLDKKIENLGDYEGKVILLHFWATWCVACLKELPELQKLWEKLQDKGLMIIAVAEDSWESVQPYVKKSNFTFPIWVDQYGQGLRDYKIKGFPATYLIGRQGNLQGLALGPREWMDSSIFNEMDSLLIIDK